MRFTFFIALLLIAAISCRPTNEIETVVSTNTGFVKGLYHSETGIYSYKGIPFAQSPAGQLRWKHPQPANAWNDTLDATQYGPICMQGEPVPFSMWTHEFIAPSGNMSEDCLNLNIWTKEGSVSELRPVIVFIHGGGFTSGSGSVPIYNGENMAIKDIVFVTMNYRVGVPGFLAHPELTAESDRNSSGNYGLMDQIAALEWIRDNISNFGGNPENVTIAGQSAGAFSVNYLAASPLARGLFHRAIAQSGASLLPTGRLSNDNSLAAAEERGIQFMEQIGAETIADLRSVPAENLIAFQGQAGSPVIDGYVLPESVYELFAKGNFNDVPLLTGWNADEGLVFGPPATAESFRRQIEQQYGEHSNEILKLFPSGTDDEARQSQLDLASLTLFGLQNWKWAQMIHKAGNSPVYLYHFERKLPFTDLQQDFGAFHTGEVPYAYNTLNQSSRPWTETDRILADRMSSYWANFARWGDPNGNELPYWPQTESSDYLTLFFGDSIYVNPVPMKSRLELLDLIYSEQTDQK